jgi:hypothetical protein
VKRTEFVHLVKKLQGMFDVPRLKVQILRKRYPMRETGTYRDVAYVTVGGDTPRLVVVERLLRMPRENVLGVLLHEFGHLVDTSDAPGAERRADRIAERVSGMRISYDADDLQTVGEGTRPRPAHLHR